MSKQIYVNFERCMNCLGCEVACDREKDGLSYISVVLIGNRFAVPLTCRQCNPAPCVMVCPPQALSLNDDRVELDAAKCTGCTLCLFACPFGVMGFNKDGKVAAKCDLCISRLKEGRDPACVLTCPSGALLYEDYDSYAANERGRITTKIIRALPLKRGVV